MGERKVFVTVGGKVTWYHTRCHTPHSAPWWAQHEVPPADLPSWFARLCSHTTLAGQTTILPTSLARQEFAHLLPTSHLHGPFRPNLAEQMVFIARQELQCERGFTMKISAYLWFIFKLTCRLNLYFYFRSMQLIMGKIRISINIANLGFDIFLLIKISCNITWISK